MKFTKMQGLGNDYVYVNAVKERVENPEQLAVRLSDRHFGIGADGLILIQESERADFGMDMYNADGSRGTMCGNGIRCVSAYLYEHGMTEKKNIEIETLSGVKETKILSNKCGEYLVKVNMGIPEAEALGQTVSIEGRNYDVDYISMGNPHAIVHLEDGMSFLKELEILRTGPLFEMHRGEVNRVNTEFVSVEDRGNVSMRVWERGSGETFACGTGACAAAVSCALRNLTEREVRIKLLGGDLLIKWSKEDGNVYMTGPAVTVFEGEINL